MDLTKYNPALFVKKTQRLHITSAKITEGLIPCAKDRQSGLCFELPNDLLSASTKHGACFNVYHLSSFFAPLKLRAIGWRLQNLPIHTLPFWVL